MTVRIVTDSSACVPEALRLEHRIAVAPIEVMVDGRAVPPGQMSVEELLERRRQGVRVTTSAPTPGAFAEVLDGLDPGDEAVVVTVAATMSATHRAAVAAAHLVDRPVDVIDTGTAAGGHALVALAAALAAEGGADRSAVAARATFVAGHVRLLAAVGSVAALAESGRVPRSVAAAADRLHVHPIFEFRHGGTHLALPTFGDDRVPKRLLDGCLSGGAGGARLHASVLHTHDPDAAGQILAALNEAAPGADLITSEFEASMIVHTGLGLLGVAWWWES